MRKYRYIMCDQVRNQVKSIMRATPKSARKLSLSRPFHRYRRNLERRCIDLAIRSLAHGRQLVCR
jgi:hypothetical protein